MDNKLQQASQWMINDMAAENYPGHGDSKGRDPFEGMAGFGCNCNTHKAENVATGQLKLR